ncbi:MAG: transcription antitermination protein nusG [Halomonas sp. 54_146]|nr:MULTISPECIES: transcription/translation regulatory transformer protein RfaH [unclassified Halomonas]KUJ86876.1 MAG: transcription antitermination protein nusG [Halomonas sp. 54_146]HAA44926.1 transcription/translation regulatory transformer protein RfaH [Halomonas sp.]
MPVNQPDATPARWYAIQCKGGESFRAEAHLLNQGFDVFHPTLKCRKKRNKKLAWVVEPLFPYYLFIHLDQVQSNWRPIRSTRGVSRILMFGNQPAVIADELIAQLKHREDPASAAPAFTTGEEITVETGPFAGQTAIFHQQLERARNGEERAIILLQWLNRAQEVEVPLAHLLR